MKITILNGKSIVDYSAYSIEGEILLSPNLDLRVHQGLEKKKDGYNYISLTQEQVGDAFVF